MFGTRIHHSTSALRLDNMGRHKISSHFPVVSAGRGGTQVQVPLYRRRSSFCRLTSVQQVQQARNTGKSRWKGGDDEVVSVEELSLRYYNEEGWKGCVSFSPRLASAQIVWHRLHSEGRIVYTIFGLLFWDIIFASIPGAFETPFQVAPLDIGADTFYHSRRELFDKRLAEIKQGKAREILRDADLKHRDGQTLCAGVRWNLVEREDLENIVEVIDNVCFLSSHRLLTCWKCSTSVATSCAKFLE